MIIDCISDLHGELPKLQGGDMLIIAGDITANDSISGWHQFYTWLRAQEYEKKILIGGNHDNFLTQCLNDDEQGELLGTQGVDKEKVDHAYLRDSGTEYKGLKIWGAPWTLNFTGQNPYAKAFGLKASTQMMEKWKLIPDDTNILITHSPAIGVLDHAGYDRYYRYGCRHLANRTFELEHLKLHVVGHIHSGYGQIHQGYCKRNELNEYEPMGFLTVNAAQMDDNYAFRDKPIRVEL